MTRKLYYEDSHLTRCMAAVLSCAKAEDGYDVVLDQTVLFPTGGGQPCDLGSVGGARVTDCREEGAEIVHRVDRPLAEGETVEVLLDWPRRFDYMQQHTGEHLLSFAFYTLFGAANVGFHLADAYATIDFDQPLSHGQTMEAERLANTYVWRNLPVTATLYESEEALLGLPIRKHAEGLTCPIRIVRVKDADCCTCCAPHCKNTGEVGGILITDSAAYKGGTRLNFLCGSRALSSARAAHDALDEIARRFSVSRDKAGAAVEKRNEEYGEARHREKVLAGALNRYMAETLVSGAVEAGKARIMVEMLEGVDPGRLKDLAQTAVKGKGPLLALLFSAQGDRLAYVLAESDGFMPPVQELMPAVNAAAGGKGGGRGTLAQGMAPINGGEKEMTAQLRQYLVQRLK